MQGKIEKIMKNPHIRILATSSTFDIRATGSNKEDDVEKRNMLNLSSGGARKAKTRNHTVFA